LSGFLFVHNDVSETNNMTQREDIIHNNEVAVDEDENPNFALLERFRQREEANPLAPRKLAAVRDKYKATTRERMREMRLAAINEQKRRDAIAARRAQTAKAR